MADYTPLLRDHVDADCRRSVDRIWASQEAMDKLGRERLMPVMKELNFDAGKPAIVSIINMVQA